MGKFSKIQNAISKMGSGSETAAALKTIITKGTDASQVMLINEAGVRIHQVWKHLEDGGSMADVIDTASSVTGLLEVAMRENGAEYREMSKSEFEDIAVDLISKSEDPGLSPSELASLARAIDAASVVFKGDNADARFLLPVPMSEVAKSEAVAEAAPAEEAPAEEAAAEEAATDEAPATEAAAEAAAVAVTEEAPADEATTEAAAEATADEATAEDAVDPATEEVTKSADANWRIDMTRKPEEAPFWGFDSK